MSGLERVVIGSRTRRQDAPPWVIFEALTEPNRDPARQWLELLDDEIAPRVLDAVPTGHVMWSSLWVKRPDATVRFEIAHQFEGPGTDLGWTVSVDAPPPDALVGHIRKRMNQLINANLRYSFGQ